MASRELWLDAGLRALARDGAGGVTIDKLAAALGLSKGSFYHHFTGIGGFKVALLDHFEAVHTRRFIDAIEGLPTASPRRKIERLLDMVLSEHPSSEQPDLEIATRAWAQQDAEVRAAQERVDRIRMSYLRDLWLALSGDAEEASQMGRLLYILLIGAGHVIPPLPAGELRRLYNLVLRLPLLATKKTRPKLTSTRRIR